VFRLMASNYIIKDILTKEYYPKVPGYDINRYLALFEINLRKPAWAYYKTAKPLSEYPAWKTRRNMISPRHLVTDYVAQRCYKLIFNKCLVVSTANIPQKLLHLILKSYMLKRSPKPINCKLSELKKDALAVMHYGYGYIRYGLWLWALVLREASYFWGLTLWIGKLPIVTSFLYLILILKRGGGSWSFYLGKTRKSKGSYIQNPGGKK